MMKLLLTLKDEDIGEKTKPGKLKYRSASRAVLFRENKIALLNVTRHKYHKLPGGGIEKNESIKNALRRELLEETGCKVKIKNTTGKIVEHRTHLGVLQISYCYITEYISHGGQKLEKGERWAGHKLEWKSPAEAMKLLRKDNPKTYEGKFIVRRDLEFIKAVRSLLRK